MNKPHLIKLNKIGNSDLGYLVVIEESLNLPFKIKRNYWTISIPNNIKRGFHAHKKTQQILVCLNGEIIVETIDKDLNKEIFELTDPTLGLYLPPCVWHTMEYKNDAIQLVMASDLYFENDYIRNYEDFLNFKY